MSQTLAWDASFELKSLSPYTHDKQSVESPITVSSGSGHQLYPPDKAVILKMVARCHANPSSYASVEVRVSYDSPNNVLEPGKLLLDNTMNEVEIPIQKVTAINFEYVAGSAVDVYFAFLTA